MPLILCFPDRGVPSCSLASSFCQPPTDLHGTSQMAPSPWNHPWRLCWLSSPVHCTCQHLCGTLNICVTCIIHSSCEVLENRNCVLFYSFLWVIPKCLTQWHPFIGNAIDNSTWPHGDCCTLAAMKALHTPTLLTTQRPYDEETGTQGHQVTCPGSRRLR